MNDLTLEINYIDIADLTQTEVNEIASSEDIFAEGLGTPTFLIIENGKVADSLFGEADYDSLKEFFLGKSKFNEITVDQYLNIFNSNTKSYIYIGRTGCGYCTKINPVLAQIIDETGIVINHVDIANISQADYDRLTNSNDILKGEWGTPTLLITKNGKVIDSQIGYAEYETTKRFLLEQK
jgi:predicted bacteriocin transport accessory protein